MADDAKRREKKSQRLFGLLILALLLGYIVMKYNHVVLAFDAYQGQVLKTDISGAAK